MACTYLRLGLCPPLLYIHPSNPTTKRKSTFDFLSWIFHLNWSSAVSSGYLITMTRDDLLVSIIPSLPQEWHIHKEYNKNQWFFSSWIIPEQFRSCPICCYPRLKPVKLAANWGKRGEYLQLCVLWYHPPPPPLPYLHLHPIHMPSSRLVTWG